MRTWYMNASSIESLEAIDVLALTGLGSFQQAPCLLLGAWNEDARVIGHHEGPPSISIARRNRACLDTGGLLWDQTRRAFWLPIRPNIGAAMTAPRAEHEGV
jgi:hypothetical protein